MKKSLLFAMLFALSVALFAQVSVNPADNFYTQVERWETMGLIEHQPSLRPYALPIVENILNKVIEGDNEVEAEVAKAIYEDTFKRPWGLILDATGYASKTVIGKADPSDTSLSKRILAKYGVEGDLELNKYITAGYQLDFLSDVFPTNNVLPYNRYFPYFMADSDTKIKNYMEVDGNMAFNYNNLYFQMGINHNSFGPFYTEGLALSPNAKHTANFSFLYNGGKWNYTQAMFVLTATDTTNKAEKAMYPNKFLMMHNLEWNATDRLALGFYETVIYGQRFDPSYMIPMLYMVTQGVTGYLGDNLLMGGTVSYRPVDGLTLMGEFYLDDAGIKEISKYHGIKLHCSGELGLKYVPQKKSMLQLLQANYTMITPIMYAHSQNVTDETGKEVGSPLSTINYQVYTTAGQKLGPSLDPNSDRIALTAKFIPVTGLTIDVGGAFIRHANVTETFSRDEMLSYLATEPGFFATDGSINQYSSYKEHGQDFGYLGTANHKTMFLTQATKEYTFQGDLKVGYDFPATKAGRFGVSVGYTFEYIYNYGVGNNMLPGGTIFYNSADGQYYGDSAFSGSAYTDEQLDTILNNTIADWKANLKNVMNHYVTINFKYTF